MIDNKYFKRMVLSSRFWYEVDKKTAKWGDCWKWTGRTFPNGVHGVFKVYKRSGDKKVMPRVTKRIAAHRMAYIFAHPNTCICSLPVKHRCGNTLCCNPWHLYLGTEKEYEDITQRSWK